MGTQISYTESERNWWEAQSVSQCTDFGGEKLETGLCIMPEGHEQAGLITYEDGRVAEIVDIDGVGRPIVRSADGFGKIVLNGVDDSSIRVTLEMTGAKIKDCYSTASFAAEHTPTRPLYFLHDHPIGSPASYPASFVAELRDRVAGHDIDVFICSNHENSGEIGVWMGHDDFGLRSYLAGLMTGPELQALHQRFCDRVPVDSPHRNAVCPTE